jgi:hypothetical protein
MMTVLQEPKPGEKWAMKSDGPWPNEKPLIAIIRDVQDGWVRYDHEGGLQDRRERLDYFKFAYERVKS